MPTKYGTPKSLADFYRRPDVQQALRAAREDLVNRDQENARHLDDKYIKQKRVNRRPPLLPIKEAIAERDGTVTYPALRLLADENVSFALIKCFVEAGFSVLEIKKTEYRGVSDERILRQARKHGMIILTHDRDFEDCRQLDLFKAPGVIILPNHPDPTMIDHCIRIMPKTICGWVGFKAIQFMPDGGMRYYWPPSTARKPTIKTPGPR